MSDFEKHSDDHSKGVNPNLYAPEVHNDEEVGVVTKGEPLHKDLKSRHMQMIAIGMSSCAPPPPRRRSQRRPGTAS